MGLIGTALLLSVGSVTHADISLSYTLDHNAAAHGYDRYNFYALNDGNNGSGTTLLTEDIELISDKKMTIGLLSNGTVDMFGAAAPDPYHSDRSFVNILGNPSDPVASNAAGMIGFSVPDNTQSTWSGGSSDIEIAGFHVADSSHAGNVGPDASNDVNGGRGALIAVAVVPPNAKFVELIPWGLASGPDTVYGYYLNPSNPDALHPIVAGKKYELHDLVATDSVPEPAMGAMTFGTLLALTRRRS